MAKLSKLSALLRSSEDNGLWFWCPGCDRAHQIKHGAGAGPRWQWNGNVDKPTFTPSILVHYDHWVPPAGEGVPVRKEDQTLVRDVCHSFVTDGKIQFLGDCTHELAGQVVDIPPFDKEW